MIRILLLNSEHAVFDITPAYLSKQEGFHVKIAHSVKEARFLLNQYPYDVIVADHEIPDLDGISFLKNIRSSGNIIPFIFFTRYKNENVAIEALNEGADFFLIREENNSEVQTKLVENIRKAVEKRRKIIDIKINEQRYREFSQRQTDYVYYIQALLDAIPAPVFYRDVNGVYCDCNKAFEALVGLPKYSIIGKAIHDFFPKELADHYRYMDDLIIRNPYIQQYEYVITDEKGEYFDVLFSKSALFSSSGEISGIVGVVLDIRDRKKLERIIIENEEKYRALADFTYDWESWLSPSGKYLYVSPSCERITGYCAQEFIEDPKLAIIISHPDDRLMLEHHYGNTPLQHDNIHHMDYRIFTKQGEEKWISHFCQSVFREDGTWLGRRESKRDITFRKEVTEAYERANKKLNLLSSITRHDILNQLTVLSGLTDLLSEYDNNADIHTMLNRMKKTIDTINTQISFTKIYQDLGVSAPQWQHVPTVITYASKEIQIPNIIVAEELSDIYILADQFLEKIFYCFFDNSERHGKRVTKASFSYKSSEKGIILCYEDNGIGIADDEKEKIFERAYGNNTGYGLFLTREIVEISGFSILENGEYGKGVRFEIFIPDNSWKREKLIKAD